ncbi:MAG: protein translocase subunit SecF [Propionibacteriaceae bacterium]|nr:protein translocase subunit SecF [Propionibacteriaceae bacterium]
MEKRHVWYAISGVLLVVCILSIAIRGLNLGVEFTGGSVFTVSTTINSDTVTEYTDVVNAVNLPDMGDMQVTTLRTAGSDQVRVQTRSLSTDEVAKMTDALGAHAGIAPASVGTQLIGPTWGTQITQKGIQALVIFLVLVALMIGLYFRNWKMSVSALIALFHDLIITIGIYALVGFTVTPATITGVLTILGYSLYDTVVVFDKVRENTANLERKDFTYSQAADLAVNQVFVRSINTTIVGVLPVLSLLIAGIVWLGGQGPLPDLGLAMFVGMITGAWSSIFIGTPILAQLKEIEPAMKQHRESLERRLGRAQTRVLITSTVTDQATVLSGAQVTSAPIPVRHAAAAGRPQPERLPRSQRRA